MVASAISQNGSDPGLTSSPDTGSRPFVAVNITSSNDSSVSSRLSSPEDNSRRGSENPPLTQRDMYAQIQEHNKAGHKRKRSGSEGPVVYVEQRLYEYSPSRRPEPQHMANRALHVLGNGGGNGPAPYYQNGVGQHNGHTWHPERPLHSHPSGNGVRPNTSDAQMAEMQQRGPNVSDATQPRPWEYQPTTDGDPDVEQYSQDPVTGAITVTPKRKRNFSNRTKTGCLTCRQRKKKCDEAQPACQNCVRGGFPCQGYSVSRRVAPTKPVPVKAPVLLQAKEGQGDVSEASIHPRPQNESSHPSRPHGHHEGGQAQPIPIDDNDGQHQGPYSSSPPRHEPQHRPPFSGGQQWPSQQNQSPYTSDPPPPLADVSRSEQPLSARPRTMSRPPNQGTSYPPHPPPPHQSQPPTTMQYPPQHAVPQSAGPNSAHPPSGPPMHQQGQWNQPAYPSAYPPASSQPTGSTHSRMSSSGAENSKPSFKISGHEDVEKSRMLRSTAYNHFDPTLIYERQRCKRALQRYNAACELDSGLSEQEIRNLLLKVIDASQDTTHKFPSQNHGRGHIGLGVKIEPPFTCTYGYNLKIQDDVYVGEGCRFDDAGTVEIGPRTVIAPGVKILTTDYGKDVVHRKGTKSFFIANDVIIASGVIIGADAIIYPGVRIEEGVTVEPGAVVRESLKANQIQRASPSQIIDRVLR